MKTISLQTTRGTRDIEPERKALQLYVTDTIRRVYELYGYQPFETPVMETMELLSAKFAAGEGSDIMKEIFTVTDQAKRKIGLRFDMTVPLCRYVAANPTVKLPFKRYAIGRVYRDGPIKLGRYREFWQADADIVGAPGPLADAEGLLMAMDIFNTLQLDVTFSFSSRELLHEMMNKIGIDKKQRTGLIIALDKLQKIGQEAVAVEMLQTGASKGEVQELLELTSGSGNNRERIAQLRKSIPNSKALNRLEEILDIIGTADDIVFEPSLARGLGYYTGFFFECTLPSGQITSSLVGTGRYDDMIGDYLQGKQQFPAVGISLGISVIVDALLEKGVSKRPVATLVYIVAVSTNEQADMLDIARLLRNRGVSTDIDFSNKSMSKNFSYADTLGIPYVMVIGENEVQKKMVVLKNMKTGEQTEVSRADLETFDFSFS